MRRFLTISSFWVAVLTSVPAHTAAPARVELVDAVDEQGMMARARYRAFVRAAQLTDAQDERLRELLLGLQRRYRSALIDVGAPLSHGRAALFGDRERDLEETAEGRLREFLDARQCAAFSRTFASPVSLASALSLELASR